MSKIFCIGFHKTGTTSLGKALEILGFSVCGWRPDLLDAARSGDWGILDTEINKYDAFQDNPWPLLFKELDKHYPGSKFILTHRDTDSWYTSIHNHFGGRSTKMREWIYQGCGDPQGNEALYKKTYENHNKAVREYFQNKNNFLEIHLADGKNWEKLCAFLDKPIPSQVFPHAKKKNTRKILKPLERLVQKFKNI